MIPHRPKTNWRKDKDNRRTIQWQTEPQHTSKQTRLNGCFLAFVLAKEFQRKSIINYNQSLSSPQHPCIGGWTACTAQKRKLRCFHTVQQNIWKTPGTSVHIALMVSPHPSYNNTQALVNRLTNLVNQVPKRTLICLNCYYWAALSTKLASINSLFCKCVWVCVYLTTNLIEVSLTLLAESV